MSPRPFWESKTLGEFDAEEWEAVCDGCGRCCLVKVEDTDSGRLYFTRAACRLLDLTSCRCRDYAHRCERVPDCLRLGPDRLELLRWLPGSCAYRRLAEGRGLAPWHPLLSGDPRSVHKAGISVAGLAVPEDQMHPDTLLRSAFDWDD